MKLYDQVRDKLRFLHYALDTEKSYLRWIDQYIRFHKVGDTWRHPRELREPEIEAFLTHLAVERKVSRSPHAAGFVSCSGSGSGSRASGNGFAGTAFSDGAA